MKKKLTNLLHFNRHVRRPLRRVLMLMAMIGLMLVGVLDMTVLDADQEVARKQGGLQSYPVKDNDILYKGGLVTIDTDGYAEPAVDTAGHKFVGVAYEKVDNTLSGHSAGGKSIRVYTEGVFLLTCTDITQNMVGQSMYVKDDDVVDDTSTNFVCAGRLVQYVGTTQGWVDIGQRVEALRDDSVTKAKLHEDICYLKLQRITAVVREILNGNDLAWTDLDLDTYVTVPAGAIGVMLETYVIDTGAARPTLSLRKNGEDTNTWQEVRNSAQVAGIANVVMLIVEFDDDHILEYRLQSTAGGGTASFYLKLVGWVMQP